MRKINFSFSPLPAIIVVFVLVTVLGCSPTPVSPVVNHISQASATFTPITITASSTAAENVPTISPNTDSMSSTATQMIPALITGTEASITVMTPAPTCSKELISGFVISGGDTNPGGLRDSPRHYVFQVSNEAGAEVNIAYISYPPTPNKTKPGYKLDFYAGEIQIGDYLTAYGCFEQEKNTLYVEEEGDYMITLPKKP